MPPKSKPTPGATFMWPERPVTAAGAVSYYNVLLCEIGPRKKFFRVGDVALFASEAGTPPFVGLIEKLFEGEDGEMMVDARWFFRPEDITCNSPFAEPKENEVYWSSQVGLKGGMGGDEAKAVLRVWVLCAPPRGPECLSAWPACMNCVCAGGGPGVCALQHDVNSVTSLLDRVRVRFGDFTLGPSDLPAKLHGSMTDFVCLSGGEEGAAGAVWEGGGGRRAESGHAAVVSAPSPLRGARVAAGPPAPSSSSFSARVDVRVTEYFPERRKLRHLKPKALQWLRSRVKGVLGTDGLGGSSDDAAEGTLGALYCSMQNGR